MGRTREIRRVVEGTPQVDGAGVKLVRVLGRADVEDFDPFLMLDAFDSRNPADYVRGFPWHPHRGIETVTYLLEGDIAHGDSLGNAGHILDGGCQWMTAGGGIIHQEMPQPTPRILGLQLWLNLPRRDKFARPQYRDLPAGAIPEIRDAHATVRVISGFHGQTRGATQGDYVQTLMLDAAVDPGATWSLPVDPESTLFIYVVAGSGTVGAAPVAGRQAALMGEGDAFAIQAGPQGLRLILFAGRPLREPIAWGGPIVMNTREELRQAFAEIEAGTFVQRG